MQQQEELRSRQSALAKTWRHSRWLALLIVASVAFTLGFACAVPFAAFGAVAALTLSRRDALLLTGAVWLVNQAIGFSVLHYPWTADTFAWGLALGVVAVLATITSQAVSRRSAGRGALVIWLATFLGAFVAYEGGLYVVAATMLGGTEDFVPAIVARMFEINAAAFVGLLVLHRLAAGIGLADRPAMRFPAPPRSA